MMDLKEKKVSLFGETEIFYQIMLPNVFQTHKGAMGKHIPEIIFLLFNLPIRIQFLGGITPFPNSLFPPCKVGSFVGIKPSSGYEELLCTADESAITAFIG